MKTRSSGISNVVLAFAVLALSAGGAGLAEAGCNAKPDGAGMCPLKVGDANVLDRCLGAPPVGPDAGKPTPLGNMACDAIAQMNGVSSAVGKSAGAMVDQTTKDMNDFVAVTMRGAYNPQSIATYNRAARFPNQLAHDVDGVLKNRTCGSEAAMRGLRTFFDQQGQNLVAVGKIGGDVGQAIGALAPAGPEALKIVQETAGLAALAASAGPEATKQLDILRTSADAIQKDLTQLAALDVAGTVAAGGDLALSVGPFLANCAGCAAALAEGVKDLTAGGAATAAGSASCPESAAAAGGGCWLTVVGVPVGTVGPALAGAVATPTCTAATTGALKMAEYTQKIERFVTTTVKLAQSLKRSVDNGARAAEALNALSKTLGKDAQPALGRIQTSLNHIVDATDSSVDIVAQKVAPATGRLATNVLDQLHGNLSQMFTCYNMYQQLAFKMSGDTVKAMSELTAATALLVDGGRVADNLSKQSERAVRAAQDEARARWETLSKREKRLYEDLWGVPAYQVDLGKTAAHLASLNGTKIKALIDEAGDLLRDRAKALADSLEAGKRAFLDQDRLHIARAKFDEAGARAAAAERLFLSVENHTQPVLKAMPAVTAAPVLQTDIASAIGNHRLQKVQVVR